MPRSKCPKGMHRVGNKCVTAPNKKLCKMLKETVNDEHKAAKTDYPELKNELYKQYSQKPAMAVYNTDWSNIHQIIEDEKRHGKEMESLKKRVCGE